MQNTRQNPQDELLKNQYLLHLYNNKLIFFENLNCLQNDVAIYTGKGPSNLLHLGHLFLLKVLQETKSVFNAQLVYMIPDDEKYFNDTLMDSSISTITKYVLKRFKDVQIIQNTKDIAMLYPFVLPFAKFFQIGRIKSLLGLKNTDNIGKLLYAPIQCSVVNYLHNLNRSVLIITGYDQLPYFKEMNRYLEKNNKKVAYIFVKDFPDIFLKAKMSSSKPNSAIFINDVNLKSKVGSAKTGSPQTLKEHKEKGVNKPQDFFYHLTQYFNLNIKQGEYFSGVISTTDFKKQVYTFLDSESDLLKI